jgi:serine/threonine protein kinase
LTPIFKGKSEGDQLFAITSRLGRMSKTDKIYFNDRVPYEITVLSAFEDFDKEDLNVTFKMSKDKANLIDLLEKMLRYDPTQRITAKEALNHAYFDDVRGDFDKTAKK